MNQCLKMIEEKIIDGSTIVLAVSGGPDSMCLYDIVSKYKAKKNLKLVIVHVNHNVREESKEEFEFVKNIVLDNNDIFEGLEISNDGNYNESDFRNLRYDFYRDIIKKYNASYLMTAHHGDDLIETILMRIVRGSNLNGYCGLKSFIEKDDYTVLRPLIYLNKQDILNYDKLNNIKYVNDYTNDLDEYTRNRYRHHVLPFLKSEDDNVHLKFLKYSEELQKNETFINEIIKEYECDVINNNKIIISKFLNLKPFIKEKIISNYLEKIYVTDLYYVNDKNIKEIIRVLGNNKGSGRMNLPLGYTGIIEYDTFRIIVEDSFDYNYVFDKQKLELDNGYCLFIMDECDDKSNYVLRLNSSEVKLPLIVRNRKEADYLEVKNLNGKKKIKDIFIDEKVSLTERNNYPLLLDSNNNILWIPGLKKSKFDKDKTEKYDIIIKYEKESNI